MIIEFLLLAVFIGWSMKGKIKYFRFTNLKGTFMLFISFLIQMALVIIYEKQLIIGNNNFASLHILSFVFLLYFIFLNIKTEWSMIFVFIGAILNLIAIGLNNGLMPVDSSMLLYMPENYTEGMRLDAIHIIADSTTKVKILIDNIIIPRPYPLPKIISIGDIFLSLGGVFFIIRNMLGKQVSK